MDRVDEDGDGGAIIRLEADVPQTSLLIDLEDDWHVPVLDRGISVEKQAERWYPESDIDRLAGRQEARVTSADDLDREAQLNIGPSTLCLAVTPPMAEPCVDLSSAGRRGPEARGGLPVCARTLQDSLAWSKTLENPNVRATEVSPSDERLRGEVQEDRLIAATSGVRC